MSEITITMSATIPLIDYGNTTITITLTGNDLATLHAQARKYITDNVLIMLKATIADIFYKAAFYDRSATIYFHEKKESEWVQVSDVDPTRSKPFAWLSVYDALAAKAFKDAVADGRYKTVNAVNTRGDATRYAASDTLDDEDPLNGG